LTKSTTFYTNLFSKLIITGLSKSLKINVLGPDELNQVRRRDGG